ncbi:SCO family protein [Yoonia sp. SS1-5]|uniref:SCO family protein n=1 Tax=Yoonia rhodophyticola TaxID=3137370 RepID=A0AAN0MD56_9RHOB
MMRALLIGAACLASPAVSQGFPFNVGGNYALTDQYGKLRTQADPNGRAQLLFFGYANCEQICSATLPMMADIADDIAHLADVSPVMITVDPKRDTVENIGPPLTQYHDDFIGLTGTEEALQVAYDAFSVEKEVVFTDPAGQEIFAHGSFIYLLDPQGAVLTLVPPVMDVDQAIEIITPYLVALAE